MGCKGCFPPQKEKSLVQLDPSVLSEKPAWQKEKVALQAALKKAEDDLVKATARNENRPITDLSNNKVSLFLSTRRGDFKLWVSRTVLYTMEDLRTDCTPNTRLPLLQMQRLYEKYLRAESYRKSLVYQKRYLLLLLGGFQDCEQATLALIARMGAQPSLISQTSRPISRFRSAVRALIAISR